MKKGIEITINKEQLTGCIESIGKLSLILLSTEEITDLTIRGFDLHNSIQYKNDLNCGDTIKIKIVEDQKDIDSLCLFRQKTDSELLQEYYTLKKRLNTKE